MMWQKGILIKKKLNEMTCLQKNKVPSQEESFVKITELNYHEVFGKGSIGQQCKCILEGKTFEECAGDRLKS